MNKNERAQKNLWRDEAKEAVVQAKADEAARSAEERERPTETQLIPNLAEAWKEYVEFSSLPPKRQFLFQRTHDLLRLNCLDGAEADKKKWWVAKSFLGNRMYARRRQQQGIALVAPRFEAWPVEGEIPGWLESRLADQHWLWNALAHPVQAAIRDIKATIAAIYNGAEAKGLDTKTEAARAELAPKIRAALKTADYTPLQKIEKARKLTLQTAEWLRAAYRSGLVLEDGCKLAFQIAEWLRKSNGKPAPQGTEDWSEMNWNFAKDVANLPAYLQRIVKDRIDATSKARRTRREIGAKGKWLQGYPKPDPEELAGEGGVDVHFNGQNLGFDSEEMKNSYVAISAPWNPPDHRGPSNGKYRRLRHMRKVTIREPESNGQNQCRFNVLFHSVPSGASMKQYKLRAERDANGKRRWFFIPALQLTIAAGASERRIFAGIDTGWRISTEEDFKCVHVWDEARGYRGHELGMADNRWSRRYNARQANLPPGEQFPIERTPQGIRDFASRRDALQRDFKSKMGETLKQASQLPANWDRVGRRGIVRMMTQEKSLEFSSLQCIRPEYEAWAKRDQELGRIYRLAWTMLSEDLDTQRRKIAREILSGVTDVGIEDLDLKEMAERENEGETNAKRHIENVRNRSRQLTGPAKFLSILINIARKMGKRVHYIDPYHTSMNCSECGHTNRIAMAQTFTCAKCRHPWNRDENAARNLAKLARECARADTHPLRCSRNGKSLPYHGFKRPAEGQDGR